MTDSELILREDLLPEPDLVKQVLEVLEPFSRKNEPLSLHDSTSVAFENLAVLETLALTNPAALDALREIAGCTLPVKHLAQILEPITITFPNSEPITSAVPLSYFVKYISVAKAEAAEAIFLGETYDPQNSPRLKEMIEACIPPKELPTYNHDRPARLSVFRTLLLSLIGGGAKSS